MTAAAVNMVLQNIGGGSADSMTVGCLDCPSWQDCVQESRWGHYRDSTRGVTRSLSKGVLRDNPTARSENLRRNLLSFRGESDRMI